MECQRNVLTCHETTVTANESHHDEIFNIRTLLDVVTDSKLLSTFITAPISNTWTTTSTSLTSSSTTSTSSIQRKDNGADALCHMLRACSIYANILFGSNCFLDALNSSTTIQQQQQLQQERQQRWQPKSYATNLLNSIAFSQSQDPISGTSRKSTSYLWSALSYIGIDNVMSSIQIIDEIDIIASTEQQRRTTTQTTLNLGSWSTHSAMQPLPLAVVMPTYPPAIQMLSQQLGFVGNPELCCRQIMHLFLLFSASLTNQLTATDDAEFFDEQQSLPTDALRDLITLLKKLLYRLFVTSPVTVTVTHNKAQRLSPCCDFGSTKVCMHRAQLQRTQLLMISTKLFNALFARFERRAFVPVEHWQVQYDNNNNTTTTT